MVWDISYCVFNGAVTQGSPPGGFGGCNACNPGFVVGGYSLSPSSFQLLPNSVCRSNGPPQAVYNNFGTTNRNDIGFTGGPFYNPANWTNTNPMVYLLTGTPQIFPKGRTNIISINAAAVAGN